MADAPAAHSGVFFLLPDFRRWRALGDVPDEMGNGNIVVDPKTHTVWIAYAKGSQCFVQPFTVTK